jgi:hypothetical protein
MEFFNTIANLMLLGTLHQLKRRDTIAKRTDLPQPVNDIPNQTPEDRRKLMHRVSIKLER